MFFLFSCFSFREVGLVFGFLPLSSTSVAVVFVFLSLPWTQAWGLGAVLAGRRGAAGAPVTISHAPVTMLAELAS
jgi:hypothetical protein